MSITRTIELDDLTPDELAFAFCEMDGQKQAKFFSVVGKIAATWPGAGWCQQSCAISEHLDKSATETIAKLAEWVADPYVNPASLHSPGADGYPVAIEARDGEGSAPHALPGVGK